MKEVEIKLVRGASFTTDNGKLRFIKGQTKFVDKELAKKLIASERFVYTAEERGKDEVVCPYCRKGFEVTPELMIKTSREDERVANKAEEPEKGITTDDVENKPKFICSFCLRDDFGNEDELKRHRKKCKHNPKNSSKNPLQNNEDKAER